MLLEFRYLGLHLGQLSYLMAFGLWVFTAQLLSATFAMLGNTGHDLANLVHRQKFAFVSFVPRLPTRFAPRRWLVRPRWCRWSVAGRRLGRITRRRPSLFL